MPHLRTAPAFIEPKALMSIRSLELRARTVVEGLWNGLHRSPYHGFSVEFSEYRQYTSGDDLRYLDWRVFARSDRYFIKKFEDETNLRCHLLVDLSRSMTYSSSNHPTKANYAATLAATLGYFLYLQGDAVGLMTFDEQVRDFFPARHRAGHLRQMMISLEKPAAGGGTNLVAPFEKIVGLVRKRGLMVLVSDLLAPTDRLERALVSLHACGHEVSVFQILDPSEQTLDLGAASVLRDPETGQRLYIDPAAARAAYLENFEKHQQSLRTLCGKLGIGLQVASTDQPLEKPLLEFLQSREGRSRASRAAASTTRT